MIEIVDVKESTAKAVNEDVKKLEDTMATDGMAPMPKSTDLADFGTDEDEIVSRGMPDIETPAPSDPVHPIEELSTEFDVEGGFKVSVTVPGVQHGCNNSGNGVATVATKKNGSKVFDSGLKVIKTHTEKIPVKVPAVIINVCNSLQRKVDRNEFSIVCKGHWEDGEYIVSDDFKVPKQEVAGASVDYDLEHLEELKLAGYNTVIHSHPFKSSNFSSSDDETINSHFECSVLYSVGEFTTATVAISGTPGVKFILTGDPKIEGEDGSVPASEANNIVQKYKATVNYYNGYNAYHYKNADLYNWDGCNNNNNSRNVGRNIGSDPEECEKEFARSHKDDFRGKGNLYTKNYEYDQDDDILYKRGKPVNNPGSARKIANIASQTPIKVHTQCGCGCGTVSTTTPINNTKVFHTEAPIAANVHANQKPPNNVFRTDISSKNNRNAKHIKCKGKH
jgi:hypothetical protein